MGGFKVHKTCYDKFNESKRTRANSAKKRKIEEGGDSSRKTRSQCPPSVPFREEHYMYCGQPAKVDTKHPGNDNPLHVAAGKHIASDYVERFTDNERTIATKLGDTKILTILGSDVRSSELYYHSICYAKFKRKYDNFAAFVSS